MLWWEKLKKRQKSSKSAEIFEPVIDNFAFQAHYKFMYYATCIATMLVGAYEYLGQRINCIYPWGVSNAANTFCFFATTYTVTNYEQHSGELPGLGHPGEKAGRREHTYYQWVVFVLFFMCLINRAGRQIWVRPGKREMFYIGDYIMKNWKRLYEKRPPIDLRRMEEGLKAEKSEDQSDDEEKEKDDSKDKKDKKDKKTDPLAIVMLARYIHYRASHGVHNVWVSSLIQAEIFNIFSLIVQIMLLQSFLRGIFIDIPWRSSDMNLLFPLITKCDFRKFGPSGTVQHYDILCVMSLNLANQWIFIILWYAYAALLLVTIANLVWRAFSFFAYHRIPLYVYPKSSRIRVRGDKIYAWHILFGTFSDWLYLRYVAANMPSSSAFGAFLEELRLMKGMEDLPLKTTLPEYMKEMEKRFPSQVKDKKPQKTVLQLKN